MLAHVVVIDSVLGAILYRIYKHYFNLTNFLFHLLSFLNIFYVLAIPARLITLLLLVSEELEMGMHSRERKERVETMKQEEIMKRYQL